MASESGINPAPRCLPICHQDNAVSLSRNLCRDRPRAETSRSTPSCPGPCRTEGGAKLIEGLYPGVPTAEAERRFVAEIGRPSLNHSACRGPRRWRTSSPSWAATTGHRQRGGAANRRRLDPDRDLVVDAHRGGAPWTLGRHGPAGPARVAGADRLGRALDHRSLICASPGCTGQGSSRPSRRRASSTTTIR